MFHKVRILDMLVIGKHPILLSNQSKSYSESGVSRVTEDIFGSMKELCRVENRSALCEFLRKYITRAL